MQSIMRMIRSRIAWIHIRYKGNGRKIIISPTIVWLITALLMIVNVALAQTNQGFLNIKSTPSKAMVFVDGTKKGATPAFLSLPVGNHNVEIIAPNYKSATLLIEIKSKIINYQEVILREKKGEIKITTNPEGATILLDGKELDIKTSALIDDVEPGSHEVKLRKYLGSPINTTVELTKTINVYKYQQCKISEDFSRFFESGIIDIHSNKPYTFVTLTHAQPKYKINIDTRDSLESIQTIPTGSYTVEWGTGEQLTLSVNKSKTTKLNIYDKQELSPLKRLEDHADYLTFDKYLIANDYRQKDTLVTSISHKINVEALLAGSFFLTMGTAGLFSKDAKPGGVLLLEGLGLTGLYFAFFGKEDTTMEVDESAVKYNRTMRKELESNYEALRKKWHEEIDNQNEADKKKNEEIEKYNNSLPNSSVSYE